MKEFGVAVIGYGFIGKVHTYSYLNIPLLYDPAPARLRLVGVCTSRRETCEAAGRQAGFEQCTTDYRELLARPDVHLVSICTPNYLHREVLLDALAAGKHIYCDKPLAMNGDEADQVVRAAQGTGLTCQVTFNYRFIPAVMRARQLVAEGFLGRVNTFRFRYLHSGYTDPDRPLSWRMDLAKSGGGALMDLGSHAIDLLHYLLGPVARVNGLTRIFTPTRPVGAGSDERVPVHTDELAMAQVELLSGAVGTLEASRVATGTNDDLAFEIHGDRGALRFTLEAPDYLEAYDAGLPDSPLGGRRGWTRIETLQRYPAPAMLPPGRATTGWMRFHVASMHAFVSNAAAGLPGDPSFADGLAAHRVMDAIYASARTGTWTPVEGG